MKTRIYDFFSHQPYLEHNRNYQHYSPKLGDPMHGIIWDAYQVDDFDATLELALPDVCADIMTLYTDKTSYTYFMGGTERMRTMNDIPYLADVKTIMGIKFCPGSIGNIFTEELCDVAGNQIDISDIMVKGNDVQNQLRYAEDFGQRIRILSRYINGRLDDGYEVDSLASYVTRRVMATHGAIKIKDICDETGYSDRYIRKVMKRKLGTNLKTFRQLVQLQWTYDVQKSQSSIKNIAALALECGYYDQSHMDLAYKKLTGMLPKDVFNLYETLN